LRQLISRKAATRNHQLEIGALGGLLRAGARRHQRNVNLPALERSPGRQTPAAGRDNEPSISFEAARSEHIRQRFHSHNVGGTARDANREPRIASKTL
jgi:hypothetical protein